MAREKKATKVNNLVTLKDSMSQNEERKKEIKKEAKEHYEVLKRGAPSKYEEEKHITLLFEITANGGSFNEFQDKACISDDTFYYWQKKQPLFKEAVDRARNKSLVFWEKLPIFVPKINYNYWKRVMLTRFDYGKVPLSVAYNEDSCVVANEILKSYMEGKISGDEAVEAMGIVASKQKINLGKKIAEDYESLSIAERRVALDRLLSEKNAELRLETISNKKTKSK